MINFLKKMYEVWCQALLATHLTRRGKWQSATKLMNK
jgi:hypothetical protein